MPLAGVFVMIRENYKFLLLYIQDHRLLRHSSPRRYQLLVSNSGIVFIRHAQPILEARSWYKSLGLRILLVHHKN